MPRYILGRPAWSHPPSSRACGEASVCPGWCSACSMQNAFCTPNGYARRGGSHPYVKNDRSTVQMVLFTFSGPLPRRTEGRFYWRRPNPQGRQSLHVDGATGTAVNKECYSEWLAILGCLSSVTFLCPQACLSQTGQGFGPNFPNYGHHLHRGV